jgi:hypothetical protein
MSRVILASICLAFFISSPSVADQNGEWGYLWDLRTMRLHTLAGTSVTVGRLRDSDVVLFGNRVSRRHAEIRRSADRVELSDSGSSNGTRLNDSLVLPGDPSLIAPGDLIQFASEVLVYHESKSELWKDVLRFTYLSKAVRLRVPVLQDFKVKTLGREKITTAVSRASVDPETGEVQMTYPEGTRRQAAFPAEEATFVCNVSMGEGEVRLSLWGLGRGKLVSRRGSLEDLAHGELAIGISHELSPAEVLERFEAGWATEGIYFLFPLLDSVLERSPKGPSTKAFLELARGLLKQESAAGSRDAADMLALQHRLDPANKEIVLLAARAEAGWVQRMVETNQGGLSDQARFELTKAMDISREWMQKAIELDVREKDFKRAEAEIAQATKLLEGLP